MRLKDCRHISSEFKRYSCNAVGCRVLKITIRTYKNNRSGTRTVEKCQYKSKIDFKWVTRVRRICFFVPSVQTQTLSYICTEPVRSKSYGSVFCFNFYSTAFGVCRVRIRFVTLNIGKNKYKHDLC